MPSEKNTLYCSFCGKSQHEVRKLIAGPTVFICDECVELCMDIIREENKNTLVKSRDGVPSPQEICAVLDSYVIGHRWWTLSELERSGDYFAPRRLASLLPAILRGDFPEQPIDCGV